MLFTAIVTIGALSQLSASSPPTHPLPAVRQTKGSYQSEGKPISFERFEPNDKGKHPAIVMLHGADGMFFGPQGYRDACRKLAESGYVVEIIHYFEKTGAKWAGLKEIQTDYIPWMKAIGDGIADISKLPNVDPAHIGLLGISLGASLAIGEAAVDTRVKAVVEYFGGMPESGLAYIKRIPPTLILHGDSDFIVPVENAHRLEKHFKKIGAVYDIHIYKGQGHGFTGNDAEDSSRRALDFFNKHLRK